MIVVDRHVTPEHLPWAKSRSSEADENLLMTRLEEFAERFSRAATPPTTGSTQQATPQTTDSTQQGADTEPSPAPPTAESDDETTKSRQSS